MSGLAEELAQFLREKITSYEELEVLRLLARRPVRSWSVTEVAANFALTPEVAAASLSGLLAAGELLQAEPLGNYRYAPANDRTRALIEQLERACNEQRTDVVQAMTTNAIGRVRSSAARRLADALRSDKPKP